MASNRVLVVSCMAALGRGMEMGSCSPSQLTMSFSWLRVSDRAEVLSLRSAVASDTRCTVELTR